MHSLGALLRRPRFGAADASTYDKGAGVTRVWTVVGGGGGGVKKKSVGGKHED